jgi:hypothetical protein
MMNPEFFSVFDRFPFSDSPPYWILFNGTKVSIHNGEYGNIDSSALYFQLQGSSGGTGYQVAREQQLAEKGPVPEGDYTVNLGLDPKRKVTLGKPALPSAFSSC